MVGKNTVTFHLFGFIPIFSKTLKTVGPSAKDIAKRLTPEVLKAVHADALLVDKISDEVAERLQARLNDALNRAANAKR